MEKFIETNPGFERRVPHTFHFADYSCNDLSEIMHVMLLRRNYEFPMNMDFPELFSSIPPTTRSLYNASLCEKLCKNALFALESRISLDCSKAEASRFEEKDFEDGMKRLRERLVKEKVSVVDVGSQTDITIPADKDFCIDARPENAVDDPALMDI